MGKAAGNIRIENVIHPGGQRRLSTAKAGEQDEDVCRTDRRLRLPSLCESEGLLLQGSFVVHLQLRRNPRGRRRLLGLRREPDQDRNGGEPGGTCDVSGRSRHRELGEVGKQNTLVRETNLRELRPRGVPPHHRTLAEGDRSIPAVVRIRIPIEKHAAIGVGLRHPLRRNLLCIAMRWTRFFEDVDGKKTERLW